MEGDEAPRPGLARHHSVVGDAFGEKLFDLFGDEGQFFVGEHRVHETGDGVLDDADARPDDIDGHTDSDQGIERQPAGNCYQPDAPQHADRGPHIGHQVFGVGAASVMELYFLPF